MKKIIFFFVCVVLTCKILAQDKTVTDLQADAGKSITKDPNDTIPKIWKKGGLFNVNFGQTSLSNWAGGGDKLQLNVNGFLNLYAFYAKDKNAWDNSLDLALGYVKTTSLGERKSDDRIDFTSKYGYKIAPKWYPGVLFNFRSQFAPGFNYPKADSSVKISQFAAPAYVLLSLGIDYKPNKHFSLFISPLTSRWIIVNAELLGPGVKGGVYGVPLGKKSVNEIGAFLSATYMNEIVKNVTYKGKLDLFSNYKKNPQNIDVYMTNLLSANIFKGISVNLGLDVIYDDDVRVLGKDNASRRTQFRQYIGVGYLKKF
jgi:Protein of unknown function (DUF3078)